jgi:hypothetical protein
MPGLAYDLDEHLAQILGVLDDKNGLHVRVLVTPLTSAATALTVGSVEEPIRQAVKGRRIGGRS